MRDAAGSEGDVGANLVPRAEAACFARGVLLSLDPAEFDARRALGDLSRESAPLEVVRTMRDVAPELVVHLALERPPADEVTKHRSCATDHGGESGGDGGAHSDSGVARSAAVMPATVCSQLERSSRSCLRPAGVSE